MRVALATSILVLAAALAACGDDPEPKRQIGASDFSDPENGVSFRSPAGAVIGEGKEKQVVVLRRGDSTLVVSRFEREGVDLPRTETQIERAARALEGEYLRNGSRKTDAFPDTATSGVMVFTEDGKDNGMHVHFYERHTEYVLDCVAPVSDFKRARKVLCDPVVATVKFTRPKS